MEYPRLNIIYDDRRIEKYPLILDELMRQNITNFFIWPAITDEKTVYDSIAKSHKKIVQWAKDRKMKEVLVAEDDLEFTSEGSFEWFLKNKPEQYDIYSACNYNSFVREGQRGATKTDCIIGFQLYFVHEKHYDVFLATPTGKHIDTEQKGGLYFCYPFAGIQRAGFSANNRAICNYNAQLNEEDFYR